MRARLKVERPRLAMAAHFLVLFGALANRHGRVGQVGNRHQQRRALLLHLVQLNLELTDLLGARLVRRKNVGRVFSLPLGARDFVARGVLLALQPFYLRNQSPAACFERGDLLELGVRLQASVAKTGTDGVHVIADVRGVEHG